MKEKKHHKEEVSVIDIGIGGVFYAFPKVVGTSFRSEIAFRSHEGVIKRYNLIDDFFDHSIEKVSLKHNFLNEDSYIRLGDKIKDEIVSGEIINRVVELDKFLKVRHVPDNRFDKNAICVYINKDGRFYDIGFLPKEFAARICREFDFNVIGVEPDGRGVRVHLILYSADSSIDPVVLISEFEEARRVEEKSRKKTLLEKSSFSSLRKVRKILEI